MRILITGGAGFVGANLAFYFNQKGEEVFVFDNLVRRGSEKNLKRFKKSGITFYHGDVRNREDLETLPKMDVILEVSAQPSAIDGYANPVFDITNNTFGCMNVLEKARRDEAMFFLWSTNKVYSGEKINSFPVSEGATRFMWDWPQDFKISAKGFDPIHGFSAEFSVDGGQHSIYGLSKIMADLMVQEWYDAFGVRTVVNRFSCLAGRGQFGKAAQGWFVWFCVAAKFNLPLTFEGFKGKQVRDALFVDDICSLIDMEIQNIDKVAGRVFNIGGGKDLSISLVEAVEKIELHYGRELSVNVLPNPRKADHVIYISDNRFIENTIGWKPQISLKKGYEDIYQWIEENQKELEDLYL